MEKHQRPGPFLEETKPQEYDFELEKLPAELRQIRSYIVSDRDTKQHYEIIVEWGNRIIYRNKNVSAYSQIVKFLKDGKYSIEIYKNEPILIFPRKISSYKRMKIFGFNF